MDPFMTPCATPSPHNHAALWPEAPPMMDSNQPLGDTGGFREMLDGLQVREIQSPDLFQMLFGASR